MTHDARISIGLPAHPKTKKLIKRHGQAAAWSLVCLFLWAASNRPDGNLAGMSTEDIELASDWLGDDGAFVAALVDVKFLDQEPDGFVLHDWAEHNPWAAGSDMRSAKAKWNAAKRHHGVAEADRLVPEYASTRNAASNASSKNTAGEQKAPRIAPSPSPSPLPSHNSDTVVSGGQPPKLTDPSEIIFGYGLPMLTTAGTAEKQARSFLGGLRKAHGDAVLIDKLRECARAKPLQPLEWLAAALPPKGKANPLTNLSGMNYQDPNDHSF